MIQTKTETKIDRLFYIKSGDYHANAELDAGQIPLIACGELENGFVGYFDIPPDNIYRRAITVAYNGRPLTAKFHPYAFGAKDDVAVLIPHAPMQDTTLLYIAAQLNRMTWRYSYGRKCYREKLQNVSISVPLTKQNGEPIVDEDAIASLLDKPFTAYIPKKAAHSDIQIPQIKWERFSILALFDLTRGDFHSMANLDEGEYMTVSRVTSDNGVVGYFDRPNGAKVYKRGKVTVSTVGGDAFIQLDDFIATDNIIICSPKTELRPTTLFFVAFMLNQLKWRYSYGRQCYREKFERVTIDLPADDSGNLDENVMQRIVEQVGYWSLIRERLSVKFDLGMPYKQQSLF